MHNICKLKTVNKTVIAVLCCVLLLCTLHNRQSFAQNSTTDTIRLQLKWKNQFQFAGYYAAQIKGYYQSKGLAVKILPGGPGIPVINNLLTGKADVGVFDPGVLLKKNVTDDLIVLATIMQSSAYCIISLKDKNILKPADLVGKTVLVESSQGWGIFKAILLKEGINTDSINIVERLKDSEEILTNKADAVVTYISSQPQRFAARNHAINIIRPEEYGVDFYGDVLLSTKKFARKDEEITTAFIEATLMGWEYALANEDELITHILTLDDVKSRGITREYLKYEAGQIRKLIMPQLVKVGHTNFGRWQYMLTVFQELDLAEKDVSLKGFIYDVEMAKQSRWYMPFAYISVAILLIVFGVSLINSQLRKRVKASTRELRKEIEQRKEAEQIANENKEQLELILNSSNIGLWEISIEGSETTFNPQFRSILGYKNSDDFCFDDFFKKIHPEDLDLTQSLFSTDELNHTPRDMVQFRIENAKGDYMYVLSSAKLIYKSEKPFKISGILLSIDELKEKELQVVKVSNELIRRNNELKKFAYITSHSLRGPVVNISCLSQMIDQKQLTDQNATIFEKMGLSIKKLENTLDDLVEVVAHDKSGNFSSETIDVIETVNSVVNAIKSENPEFDLIMDVKVNKLMLPKHTLISIIVNLVTNALKFRAIDRKLRIELSTYNESDHTILTFTDNGIGINLSKHKHKIFSIYQRVNQQIEGKGVGLFIVKSHMDTLNGKIEVDSVLGESTTFKLYFPNIHFN